MTKFKFKSLLTIGLGLYAANVSLAQFTESLNSGLVPLSTNSWSAKTIVFDYSPSFSYSLGEVDTFLQWHGVSDAPALTVDIWDANPATGGHLLASSSMTGISYGWASAVFSTPVSLVSGSDYWIGFYNIAGYYNANNSVAHTTVPYEWYLDSDYGTAMGTWGTGAILGFKEATATASPAAVPEAGAYGLMGGLGLAGLSLLRRRRKA